MGIKMGKWEPKWELFSFRIFLSTPRQQVTLPGGTVLATKQHLIPAAAVVPADGDNRLIAFHPQQVALACLYLRMSPRLLIRADDMLVVVVAEMVDDLLFVYDDLHGGYRVLPYKSALPAHAPPDRRMDALYLNYIVV